MNPISDQQQQISNAALYFSIAMILLLLGVITSVGLWGMEYIRSSAESVASSHITKMKLVTDMLSAARERSVLLERMALNDDPFERDADFLRFNREAAKFANARIALLKMNLSSTEQELLERQRKFTGEVVPIQLEIADLLTADDFEKARKRLVNDAVPLQEKVLQALSELNTFQTESANLAVKSANRANEEARFWIILMAIATAFIGVSIAMIINARVRQGNSQREIYFQEIEKANRSKSAFLANMSHEIRTPLTSIIGYAEAIKTPSVTTEVRESAVATIIRNGKHLLSIINDILDLSKIEANKLTIENIETDPLDVISEVESIFGSLAREKGLTFEVNVTYPYPASITTDPLRFKQIIINLVGNAIKFTSQGTIKLQSNVDYENQLLVVKVIDSGIGMDQDALAKLFNPFIQADSSTTRKFGGTGLGLTISKNLAQMLGGTIICESVVGKGTTFTVSIATGKVNRTNMRRDVSEYHRRHNNSIQVDFAIQLRGKVLVAEDSPDIRELVKMYLAETGVEFTCVENGKLAIEKAMERSFDLILMDIQMPEMDGRSAIAWLRKVGNSTPIVALTANAMKEEVAEYFQIGASAFLAKPIDRSQFITTLTKYLKMSDRAPDVTTNTPSDAMKKLIENFKNSLPNTLREISDAIDANDPERLRFVAHTLKGIGSSYGYPEITEFARRIETYAKNNSVSAAKIPAAELRDFCEQKVVGK